MPSPVRYPSGITNNSPTDIMRNLITLDESKYIRFFDDFYGYTAANWINTVTQAGSGSATATLPDELGGSLLITNDNADNDNSFFQWCGASASVTECFKFVAGKQLWFSSRLKVSDATQCDFVMGLQITDTSPLAVSDGVYFIKNDDAATLDLVVTKASTATTVAAISTIVSDTYVTLEYYYDGKSTIEYGINGAVLGAADTTNMPNTQTLALSFGIQNGAAAIKTMNIDYILVIQER